MITEGKSFFDLNTLNGRLMNAIEVVKAQQRIKEQTVFDYFNIKVPEGFILILPEKFHSSIGDSLERIRFSPYIKDDVAYIVDKSKMDNILNSENGLLMGVE